MSNMPGDPKRKRTASPPAAPRKVLKTFDRETAILHHFKGLVVIHKNHIARGDQKHPSHQEAATAALQTSTHNHHHYTVFVDASCPDKRDPSSRSGIVLLLHPPQVAADPASGHSEGILMAWPIDPILDRRLGKGLAIAQALNTIIAKVREPQLPHLQPVPGVPLSVKVKIFCNSATVLARVKDPNGEEQEQDVADDEETERDSTTDVEVLSGDTTVTDESFAYMFVDRTNPASNGYYGNKSAVSKRVVAVIIAKSHELSQIEGTNVSLELHWLARPDTTVEGFHAARRASGEAKATGDSWSHDRRQPRAAPQPLPKSTCIFHKDDTLKEAIHAARDKPEPTPTQPPGPIVSLVTEAIARYADGDGSSKVTGVEGVGAAAADVETPALVSQEDEDSDAGRAWTATGPHDSHYRTLGWVLQQRLQRVEEEEEEEAREAGEIEDPNTSNSTTDVVGGRLLGSVVEAVDQRPAAVVELPAQPEETVGEKPTMTFELAFRPIPTQEE
ncbi:hypothetical protein B0T22DRAFT_441754 [Podospora appendiculata]|uniref:Uncharacterized protein n=1 Tax=Podospora appendiculata TaxID=314037 RepID=A0AAE0XDC3_9PEZI|nr:hypothetical protein B0T22DRAFT_441754 [Podospora appendiculata]